MRKSESRLGAPAFVKPVEQAGGEGISGAVGADHLRFGHVQGRAFGDNALACYDHGARWEMHANEAHRALTKHAVGCADTALDSRHAVFDRCLASDGADL